MVAVLGALAAVILWLATVTSGIADVLQLLSPFGDNTKITIDPPETGRIPVCATFRGSAPVKKGKVLWLIHGNTDHYVLKKATPEPGDRWSVMRTTDSGPEGSRIEVYVFYVDEPLSRFMDGLWARGSDGKPSGVFTKGLPPGAQDVVHQFAARDGPPNNTACP